MLAMLVCRQPTRRLLIARVALLASLAMIPLVALVPLPRLDLLDTLVQSDLVPSVVDPRDSSKPGVSGRPDRAAMHDVSLRSSRIDLPRQAAGNGRWLPRSLTLIDLACVGTGMAWLLLGVLGSALADPPFTCRRRPPTQKIFDRLSPTTWPDDARPALRCQSRVQHPVVVGFLHPTILIPPALDEPGGDPELLRLSLLHEIAHADQWDPWFGTIASLAQTVWFFLPQIWWLRSQLLIDQEFLADRSAAAPLRHVLRLCGVAAVAGGVSTGPDRDDPRPSEPENGWPGGVQECEVRSPLVSARAHAACIARFDSRRRLPGRGPGR